ncbi:MAG: DUF3098 domain-containing protein [Flavobacteriia bacterium]|nr:DUF3098 domain-containing protein [Flavobacteriia bacterium]
MSNMHHFGFDPKNFKILIIGLLINVIGFILMIGGGSDDPNVFNEGELFSPVRITIAPFFIVVGYIVIFFAIMKKFNRVEPFDSAGSASEKVATPQAGKVSSAKVEVKRKKKK